MSYKDVIGHMDPESKETSGSFVYMSESRKARIVEEEPKILTKEGLRKSDIVARMGRTLVVLDAQIIKIRFH